MRFFGKIQFMEEPPEPGRDGGGAFLELRAVSCSPEAEGLLPSRASAKWLRRNPSASEVVSYRVGLIPGSKVQCVFCFETCTTEGRGGEKRGECKYQNGEHRTLYPMFNYTSTVCASSLWKSFC